MKKCSMKIWIITVGEPLPMDDGEVRAYRSGLLFNELVNAGHEVTWWTSSFDHSQKKIRTCGDKIFSKSNSKILLLNGPSYKKNISFKRIVNHRELAKQFINRVDQHDNPDLIICSFPIIELCDVAVKYANKNEIPIIIDVRDLWPDIFLDFVPKWSRYLVRIILYKMFRNTEFIFKNSTQISAISDGYLNWALKKAKRISSNHDKVYPIGYPEQKTQRHSKNISDHFQSLGIDKTKIIILFIGSFGKTYDLSTVIKAAAYFNNKNNNLQFVFCGDGDNYDKWTKEAQDVSNIFFTGWIDSKGINYLLNISSIGLAAYAEGAPQGLPNKLFEYMSVGLPILSSLEGETKELIYKEKIGLTYISSNHEDLIQKIEYLLDINMFNVYKQNSSELFSKKFSAKSIYSEFRNEIERLALTFINKRKKY